MYFNAESAKDAEYLITDVMQKQIFETQRHRVKNIIFYSILFSLFRQFLRVKVFYTYIHRKREHGSHRMSELNAHHKRNVGKIDDGFIKSGVDSQN